MLSGEKIIMSSSHKLVCYILAILVTMVGFAFALNDITLNAQTTPLSQRAGDLDLVAIDKYLEGQMAALRIPGLALGIVQGKQIVHLKGYGVADASGRLVTPQTPFLLNSISKSFVALAVMQLVEQGKIELDAPVQRYLPWFRVADASASAQITMRHLLNHTSGLGAASAYAYLSSGGVAHECAGCGLQRAGERRAGGSLVPGVGWIELGSQANVGRFSYCI
jgi:CubicO group peptidase (beta-lactamase class C family)